jgi:hypothetical protein
VRQLAQIHCTLDEMALILGCHHDTLTARFSGIIKEARATGKMSLKRVMWKKALEGNVPILIWLSKNELGYSDTPKPNIEAIPEDYPEPKVEMTETCSDDGPEEE